MFSFRLFGDYCKPQNVRGFLKIVIKELHGFFDRKKDGGYFEVIKFLFHFLAIYFFHVLYVILEKDVNIAKHYW